MSQLQSLLSQIEECDREMKELQERRSSLVHHIQSLKTITVATWKRFQNGDYIVIPSGRHWWCNNSNLIERVTQEEFAAIDELVKHKIIVKEFATPSYTNQTA